MAQTLSQARIDAVFSYAGRTAHPMSQPLPLRVGGFGGEAGLIRYLKEEQITHVIDATHPFAARMSQHAFEACTTCGVPLIRLERPAWVAQPEDSWRQFDRLEDIPVALPQAPARVFLAIGRQQLPLFATRPEHHYLLRLVDAPEGPLPLPNTTIVLARGPFDIAQDTDLLRSYQITHVVAKNSGGAGAAAKLSAARALGIPVWMAARPTLPGNCCAETPKGVMRWLGHSADLGV